MQYSRLFLVLTTLILGASLTDVSAQIVGESNNEASEQTTSFVTVKYTDAKTTAKRRTPSTALERKIFKNLIRLPRYGVFDHISFILDGGTLTLRGKVNAAINKSDAERSVKRIEGVSVVVNNIEILPPSSFDDSIRRRTLRSLSLSGGLYRYFLGASPQVRIVVKNGRVELEGSVDNRRDLNRMNVLANGVSSVFSVTNNLMVREDETAR